MKNAKIAITNNMLEIITATGLKRSFDFPAVAVSLQGRYIKAEKLNGNIQKINDRKISAVYANDGLIFDITVEVCGPCWVRKKVVISSLQTLPTLDFVIVDYQKQNAPNLQMCGYMISAEKFDSLTSEEEGAGITPGCGYPLIGDKLFIGLEHPAAFNRIIAKSEEQVEWELRHHPVWVKNIIECIPEVIGLAENPKKAFMDYLSEIRLPPLNKFLVSFCSFWSDPYLGNFEYQVSKNNYESFVNAFSKMKLYPDVYTLDAGWQDRQTCFEAKKEIGGEKGLKKLAKFFKENGSNMSLWVSHNGPTGMSREFMEKAGLAIGSGQSSTYSGDNYAVMLDANVEKLLTKRFCELASKKYGAIHFKMDWENDCATNLDFTKTYPTRNHVREESINVMSRISKAMRKVNPDVLVRNGWWPSPWWLSRSNHTFLTDSGDSEYASFPSLSQREAATTQRDIMYYASLQRNQSAYPLDAYDNHEFPHALRNPFIEKTAEWSNTCLWAFMRGTSYLTLTLQPEALENWQAKTLRDVLNFSRKNTKRLLTKFSQMVGGSPSLGEIYGFMHSTKKGNTILALRNPSPIPQSFTLPQENPYWVQCYPHYENFKARDLIWLAPHEVKIFDGRGKEPNLPSKKFMLKKVSSKHYAIALPSSQCSNVAEVYQIHSLEKISLVEFKEKQSYGLNFGIRCPYKMRNFKLFIKLKGDNFDKVKSLSLLCSRYEGRPLYSCWQVPYQEHFYNLPGHGEKKNPDLQPIRQARYFSAEIPQGGQCFFDLTFLGTELSLEDIELYASGYEAPSDTVFTVERIDNLMQVVQHPDGFPWILKLM